MDWNKFASNAVGVFGDSVNMINTLATPITKIDSSSQQQDIEDINTQFSGTSDDLMAQFSTSNLARTNYNARELGWNGKSIARNILTGGLAGGQLGNTIGGLFGKNSSQNDFASMAGIAAGGLVGGAIAGALIPKYKKTINQEVDKLNILASQQNAQALSNFANTSQNSSSKMFNNSMLNLAAFGGDLNKAIDYKKASRNNNIKLMKTNYIGNKFSYGGDMKFTGDFSNGVTIIGEGGTHEQNKYDGVQVGVDPNGIPNLVEEGEVIFDDYVFSNRLYPNEKQLEKVNLDKSFANKPFSDIAKELQKYSSERPNDPIAKNGLIDSMTKLQVAQEDIRQRKEANNLKNKFNKLSNDEKELAINMLFGEQQNGINEEFAYGGKKGNMFEGIGPDKNSMNFIGPMPRKVQYQNVFPQTLNDFDSLFINKAANRQLEDAVRSILFSDNINKNSGVKFWNSPSGVVDNTGITYQYHPYLNISGPIYEDLKIDGEIPSDIFGQNNLVTNTPQTAVTKFDTQRQKESQKTTLNKNYKSVDIPEISMSDEELDSIISSADKNIENDIANVNRNDIIEKNKLVGYNPQPKAKALKHNTPLNYRETASRYAPVFANAIGSLVEAFTPIDYSDADIIGNAANNLPRYNYNPIGNYITYNPVDQNYLANKIANESIALQRQAMNSGSNRGQAMANLMAIANNSNQSVGNTLLNAYQANNAAKNEVAKFNSQIDSINSQLAQSNNQLNAGIDARKSELYQYMAQLRDRISTAKSEALSGNFTDFANALGNVGLDNFYANQQDWYNRFVTPNNKATKSYMSNGGKIKKNK